MCRLGSNRTWGMMSTLALVVLCYLFLTQSAPAACPSADLTGDCFVDFEDFALMANQWSIEYDWEDLAVMASEWLVEGVPEDPNSLVWVYIDDPGVSGHEGFTGYMSKYETTNAQYCQYLNEALASDDITISSGEVYGNSGPYNGEIHYDMDDSDAQISYSGGTFFVESRDGYSMANHPVVEVSWYGATAFCNYYGYRLPTEWEWQAVADYNGSYTYGCGTIINQSKANYYDSGYANPLNLSSYPYTSPVDHYSSYGYGMNDMAGNVWEWTSSIYGGSSRVLRGGGWYISDYDCSVSNRVGANPYITGHSIGFRVCR
ncbi:MAG: SUMF1/EgtB/PvdO family nonheme iron enzyme [Planctomycetes bacterium]|nr:SUMF1/EgtB/PvdO family nonheme iron enzyme [Planctomycetota bacterium]